MTGGKLTKADIVDAVYNSTGIERRDARFIFDRIILEIKDSLASGKAIELRGFGTFEPRIRKGRTARNPRTGDRVDVAKHGIIFFRPGLELKEAVWTLKNIDEGHGESALPAADKKTPPSAKSAPSSAKPPITPLSKSVKSVEQPARPTASTSRPKPVKKGMPRA
jgi:integration host factor subunit beta